MTCRRIQLLLLLTQCSRYPVKLTDLIQNRAADPKAGIRLKLNALCQLKLINRIDQTKYPITGQIIIFNRIPEIHSHSSGNNLDQWHILNDQLFS